MKELSQYNLEMLFSWYKVYYQKYKKESDKYVYIRERVENIQAVSYTSIGVQENRKPRGLETRLLELEKARERLERAYNSMYALRVPVANIIDLLKGLDFITFLTFSDEYINLYPLSKVRKSNGLNKKKWEQVKEKGYIYLLEHKADIIRMIELYQLNEYIN